MIWVDYIGGLNERFEEKFFVSCIYRVKYIYK